MKKSELRQMLKEVVEECLIELLPEMLNLVSEVKTTATISEDQTFVPSFSSYKRSEAGGYDGVTGKKPAQTNIPKPNNARGNVNGDHFASGKGILEWRKSLGKIEAKPEFNHSNEDMNSLVNKLVGK